MICAENLVRGSSQLEQLLDNLTVSGTTTAGGIEFRMRSSLVGLFPIHIIANVPSKQMEKKITFSVLTRVALIQPLSGMVTIYCNRELKVVLPYLN